MAKKLKSKILFYFFSVFLIGVLLIPLIADYVNKADAGGPDTNRPRIYIDGNNNSRSRGGIILLSSLDEPSIQMSGYNLSGNIHINVYKTDMDNLLDFLVHDDKKNQLDSSANTDGLPFVASLDVALSEYRYSYRGEKTVLLPINADGVFLLDMKIDKKSHYAYVVRSNFGTVAHEAQKEIIFWSQDFVTKKSRTGGSVTVYNLEDKKEEMDKSIINNDGIAKTKISEDVDVAVIKSDGSESLVFLNLKYLNSGYGESGNFEEVQPSTKYFAFTDRPIYKPGDTVKFKSIMRADLDADYKIFSGEIKAEVYTGYGQNKTIVYTDKFNIDNYGAVDGEFIIPKSAKTGNYTINLKKEGEQAVTSRWGWGGYTPSANINFLVEHYRKPEYTLDSDMEYAKVIAYSDLKMKIQAQMCS